MQLFIFYIGYVGFSHFGLTDGIYLRLGGSVYEELDYVKYKTQLVLSLLIQFSIAVVALFVFSLVQIESMRMTVLSWTFIYMLIFNAAGYLGYIFQAVNQTRVYSISIMIDRNNIYRICTYCHCDKGLFFPVLYYWLHIQ